MYQSVKKTSDNVGRFSSYQAMLLILSLVFLASGVLAIPTQKPHSQRQTNYLAYLNARFRYSVLYPENVLYPQGEPENGDGQKFMSIHADAILTVYGQYNIQNEDLESLYDEISRGGLGDNSKRVVTYRVLRKNWFVVSGYDNGQIFYEKKIMSKDIIFSLDFVYPERQKSHYDPIATKIAGSFHRLR